LGSVLVEVTGAASDVDGEDGVGGTGGTGGTVALAPGLCG